MFLGSSLAATLIELLIALLIVAISYFKWKFSYWSRQNLQQLQPTIPFGNLRDAFIAKKTIGVVVKQLYDTMKSQNWKHGGSYFFTKPNYVVIDLELVKTVLTKDFQYFVDRGVYYNEEGEPITAHLFAIGGQKWRNLRVKLTPTFTSGKMKMMFQTLVDCEGNLQEKMALFQEKGAPVDIKEVLGCFTTDIIGSCAFGLDCNTFKDEDSPFRRYGKRVFNPTNRQRLTITLAQTFPAISKAFNCKLIPQEISDFFSGVVKDTVSYREKNNYSRKDFMQLLIELKNNNLADQEHKHDGKTLTIDEITAQCFVFFLAGFETSSTTMTFALYELAKNQEIQEKLRKEVETVLKKHEGKITYEAIQDMKYMDQVINETLRKYPPVPFITRSCIQDYKVPGEDLVLEKGTRVLVSILGIHHDPEYYPEPEKFDPERFSDENIHSRHQYAHIPFGEGPRICIGMRFGLMQSKVGLTSLLRKYTFAVSKKTQEPLKFHRNSFVLAAEGEIWLDVQKL